MKHCQNTDCNILIDPARDEAHNIVVDGEHMVVCDACYMDHMMFGDNFAEARREYDERAKRLNPVKVGHVA